MPLWRAPHHRARLRAFTPQASISQPDEVIEAAYIRKTLITGAGSKENTTRASRIGCKVLCECVKNSLVSLQAANKDTCVRHDFTRFPIRIGWQLMGSDNIYYCGTRKSHQSWLRQIHLLPFINVFLWS